MSNYYDFKRLKKDVKLLAQIPAEDPARKDWYNMCAKDLREWREKTFKSEKSLSNHIKGLSSFMDKLPKKQRVALAKLIRISGL